MLVLLYLTATESLSDSDAESVERSRVNEPTSVPTSHTTTQRDVEGDDQTTTRLQVSSPPASAHVRPDDKINPAGHRRGPHVTAIASNFEEGNTATRARTDSPVRRHEDLSPTSPPRAAGDGLTRGMHNDFRALELPTHAHIDGLQRQRSAGAVHLGHDDHQPLMTYPASTSQSTREDHASLRQNLAVLKKEQNEDMSRIRHLQAEAEAEAAQERGKHLRQPETKLSLGSYGASAAHPHQQYTRAAPLPRPPAHWIKDRQVPGASAALARRPAGLTCDQFLEPIQVMLRKMPKSTAASGEVREFIDNLEKLLLTPYGLAAFNREFSRACINQGDINYTHLDAWYKEVINQRDYEEEEEEEEEGEY